MSPDQPPQPDPAAKAAQAWAASLNIPDEIGGYRIQRVIGSGGMATVFAALQKQPRRTVALKVMKAGVATDAAFRRFKREIEILGKLHHPYIAQVYDAGVHRTAAGESVPYFVMEYISGAKTILEYIAAKELDLRDRLKLFVKVCAAVEHGHRHKVIHRDLKPGNILIDQYGEPKVIDFGVAHAAELDVSSQTMHTEAGRLIGTLQYMSPEQVEAKLTDLDARCDVYALGVILYKMLTGRPPHDLEALPMLEAVRIIREESPIAPGEIKPELRGDLETIILKAMEHDRARRYSNAGSLGRDIVRFLADKPINARRASLVYRAALFARRNRIPLAVGLVIALVICLAAAVVMVERSRLRKGEADRWTELQQTREALQRASATEPAASAPAAQPAFEPFVLKAHSARIERIAFLPESAATDASAPPDSVFGRTRLVSASTDHTVIIWDLANRRPLVTVREFDGPVTHLAAAADGSVIAAATDDGPILLIAPSTGKVLRTIRTEGGGIRSLAISPSGSGIAVGCQDLTLRVISTGAGSGQARETRVLRSSKGIFTSIAFGSHENEIAAGSAQGAVSVWEITEGSAAAPRNFSDLHAEPIGIDMAPLFGGRLVTAIAVDGNLHTWWISREAIGDGSAHAIEFNVGENPVVCIAFDRLNSRIVVGSTRGITRFQRTGDEFRSLGDLIACEDPVVALGIDAGGRWCAAGQANGDIAIRPLGSSR